MSGPHSILNITMENRSTSWLPYMGKTTNYNEWIFNSFKEYLGGKIVDIGSGSGTFTKYFTDRALVVSVEPDEGEAEDQRRLFSSRSNVEVINGHFDREMAQRLKPRGIDTVVCLNVLEHVRDDKEMLGNIHECLPEGGKLILYVPALKAIYGTLDRNLDHFRRYDKKEVEKMLKEAGFRVIKSRYVNFLGAFTWFLYSRVLKRTRPAENSILFYDKFLVPVVATVENYLHFPFGQSLLIIAETSAG
jgi:SAM-dependent methyltransferase